MKSAETILLIAHEQIARADFSGGAKPKLLELRHRRRTSDDNLGVLVDEALKLSDGIGRRVWILCEDLWTQLISVPAASVTGLPQEQLLHALAFEAEGLSGTSATDAALGAKKISADQGKATFWTTSIEKYLLDQLQDHVRKLGGKLAGIAHPSGLPAPVLQQTGTWRRVESWSQSTVCISIEGGKPRVAVFGSGSDQQDEDWLRSSKADHTELLYSSNVAAGDGLALSDPKVLEAWLTAWAAQLVAREPEIPLIVPAVQPVATRTLVTYALVCEAAMLALCFAHWNWTTRQIADAHQKAADLRAPAEQLAKVDKSITDKRAEATKLKAEVEKLESVRRNAINAFSSQKGRVHQLLSSLAECKVADVMIESINPDGAFSARVHGLCMNPAQADEMAIQLAKPLEKVGLEVIPISKQGQNLLSDGGPWKFVLSIKPKAAGAAPVSNTKNEALTANVATGGQP